MRPFNVTVARGRVIPIDSPMSDELEVQEALMTWAQWCRTPDGRARCLSAEGMYEPESGNVWDGTVIRRNINELLAEQVNGALLQLPDGNRLSLAMRYFERASDWRICRAVRVRPADYGAWMRQSRMLLARVLHAQRLVHIIPSDNSTIPSQVDAQDAQAGRSILKGNEAPSAEWKPDHLELVPTQAAEHSPLEESAITTDNSQSPRRMKPSRGRTPTIKRRTK